MMWAGMELVVWIVVVEFKSVACILAMLDGQGRVRIYEIRERLTGRHICWNLRM